MKNIILVSAVILIWVGFATGAECDGESYVEGTLLAIDPMSEIFTLTHIPEGVTRLLVRIDVSLKGPVKGGLIIADYIYPKDSDLLWPFHLRSGDVVLSLKLCRALLAELSQEDVRNGEHWQFLTDEISEITGDEIPWYQFGPKDYEVIYHEASLDSLSEFKGRLGFRSSEGVFIPITDARAFYGQGAGACQPSLQSPFKIEFQANGEFTVSRAPSVIATRSAPFKPKEGQSSAPHCDEELRYPCYRFRADGCRDLTLRFDKGDHHEKLVEMKCDTRHDNRIDG